MMDKAFEARLTDMQDSSIMPQMIERIVQEMREEQERYISKVLYELNIDEGILAKQTQEIQRLNDLLQKYKDLEEQGLLLRLPCKIGDTVYLVSACGRSDIDGRIIRVIEEKTFSEFWLRDIGKSVFLTYGEAVAKLKELEG